MRRILRGIFGKRFKIFTTDSPDALTVSIRAMNSSGFPASEFILFPVRKNQTTKQIRS